MSYSYSWLGLPASVFRNERVSENKGESSSGKVSERERGGRGATNRVSGSEWQRILPTFRCCRCRCLSENFSNYRSINFLWSVEQAAGGG